MQVAVVDRARVFRLLEVELPATVTAQDAVALKLHESGADYRLIGRLIGRTRTVAHRRVRRALRAIAPDVKRRGFCLVTHIRSGTRKCSWWPPQSLLERCYRLRGDAFGEVMLRSQTHRGHSHGRARSPGELVLVGAFDSARDATLDCRALLRQAADGTPFVELGYFRRRDHRPVGRRVRIAYAGPDRAGHALRALVQMRVDDRARRRSAPRGSAPVNGQSANAEPIPNPPTPADPAVGASPVPLPPPDADVERFADAARNLLVDAMMRPLAEKAFLDGLETPDLHERRLWWRMALEFGIGRPAGGDEDGTPQVSIVNNVNIVNHAPAPPHEDGPVDAPAPQPLPGRVLGADRAASTGS